MDAVTYFRTYLLHEAQSFKRFSATQEIPRIYGTQRFVTAFTSAHHLSLSWTSSIQSIAPLPLP